MVIENCSDDKMVRFEQGLLKEIGLYNKSSAGYELRIRIAKVLNENENLKDFRELVARLYGIAKV